MLKAISLPKADAENRIVPVLYRYRERVYYSGGRLVKKQELIPLKSTGNFDAISEEQSNGGDVSELFPAGVKDFCLVRAYYSGGGGSYWGDDDSAELNLVVYDKTIADYQDAENYYPFKKKKHDKTKNSSVG